MVTPAVRVFDEGLGEQVCAPVRDAAPAPVQRIGAHHRIAAALTNAEILGGTRVRVAASVLVDEKTAEIRPKLIELDRALRRAVDGEQMPEAISIAVTALDDLELANLWSPNQLRHSCGTRLRQKVI